MRIVVILAALAGACSSCPDPVVHSPTPVEVESSDSGTDTVDTHVIVKAAEGFANATCECTTPSCADAAANDFVEWLRSHPDREGSAVAAKRILVAMEKMLFCRDKLAYPDEPVDLDSPTVGAAPAS